MKSGIIYCVILFCVVGVSFGQTITVLDEQTGVVIEGTTAVGGNSQGVVSDSSGQMDISHLKVGELITISHVGYKTIERTYRQLVENPIVFLTSEQIGLNEYTVSASRWQEVSADVVENVVKVSGKDVQLLQPQTAADLLSQAGGVFVQESQQGGGSPMVRGFSANRLLYVVDGVRMNTAIFRGGNVHNVISLDPFAMENTEVLFGASGVMYGSDAIGGVMNFQTLSPAVNDSLMFSGTVSGRGATINNERTFHGHLIYGKYKLRFLTSYTRSSFEDLKMGSHGPEDYLRREYVAFVDQKDSVIQNEDQKIQVASGYGQQNFMQKVLWRPIDDVEVEYGFHYSTTSDIPRYDRQLRYLNGELRYGDWYYGPQKWMMHLLALRFKEKTRFYDQMNCRLSAQVFEESRHTRNFGDSLRTDRWEQVDAYAFNWDAKKRLEERQTLFYGIEGVVNQVYSSARDVNIYSGEEGFASSRYPRASWGSFGGYILYHKKINNWLQTKAGFRANRFAMVTDFSRNQLDLPVASSVLQFGAYTGSLGLIIQIENSDLEIKTQISRGMRSPNVDDVGKVFDSEPGSVVVPNGDLKEELAHGVELSIEKRFLENKFAFLGVGYYTLLDQAMVRRDFQIDGKDSIIYDGVMSQVQAIQNAGKGNVYGAQLSLCYKDKRFGSFKVDWNLQKGFLEEDNVLVPLRHVAPSFGGMKWTIAKKRFDFFVKMQTALTLKHVDMSPIEQVKTELYAFNSSGLAYSPGWYSIDVGFGAKVYKGLQANVVVSNITDQRYRPYSSGSVAAGRNFSVTMRINF